MPRAVPQAPDRPLPARRIWLTVRADVGRCSLEPSGRLRELTSAVQP
ncbi:hypothetical protein DWUX_2278 [Desulfovibrio diazotrophicus]|nr:hypothetical protein DWUX_2278 [Desulfovibrio diazotrophicus]